MTNLIKIFILTISLIVVIFSTPFIFIFLFIYSSIFWIGWLQKINERMQRKYDKINKKETKKKTKYRV